MNEEILENLKVVKRNGKKVPFDSKKVAIAIKKGFDNINEQDTHCRRKRMIQIRILAENTAADHAQNHTNSRKAKSDGNKMLPIETGQQIA